MGNCLLKRSKKSGRSPSGVVPTPSVLRLHSPSSSPWTLWIRIALSYKPISVEFFPTAPFRPGQSTAVIELGSETLSGPHEKLLQYVDSRYPDPPLLSQPEKADQPALERAVALQHCSINRHLERVAKWAVEMATRPERRSSVPSLENDPKMEVRKFGRFYAQLHELLVEHAQVEERVIFPVLEKAERGLCSDAQEEHARDLPNMNGIKEDIKSIGVIDPGTDAHLEAMTNISSRLITLLDNCKEHFEEEERELLPLLEAAALDREQQELVLGQCMKETMQSTHSNLFRFFMSGLSPRDAVQYLWLVAKCCDPKWASCLLESLLTTDGTVSSSGWVENS